MANDSMLLAFIQEAVRERRVAFTAHALEKHPVAEGFTASDAMEAILNGQIIEHREDESRCLISGSASNLKLSPDYITNYIHCVCRYDRAQNIVIITMYRPSSDEWLNHFRRKPNR